MTNYSLQEPKNVVFVVDDDPMFMAMLREHLTEQNTDFEIHSFDSGEKCLEKLDLNPQIVVLDYLLDSVNQEAANGLEILKEIKAKDEDIHVIILSGQGRFGLAAQTLMKGAYDYVIKEQDAFEKINQMIQRILEEE